MPKVGRGKRCYFWNAHEWQKTADPRYYFCQQCGWQYYNAEGLHPTHKTQYTYPEAPSRARNQGTSKDNNQP